MSNLDDVGFVFTSTLHSKCQTRCVRNVTTNHVLLTSQQYWLCDIHKIKWPNHSGREAGLWPSGNHFSLRKMCIFQPVRNIFLRLQCYTFSSCTTIGLRVSVCKKTRITICNVLATKSIARVCNLQEQLLKLKGTDIWPQEPVLVSNLVKQWPCARHLLNSVSIDTAITHLYAILTAHFVT